MSRAEDPMLAGLRPMGERNKKVIELIHAFCSHARVEEDAHGAAEPALGLPVNRRSVRCAYAKEDSWSAMELEPVAIEFYNANCLECPYQAPTGILPNLAMLAAEHMAHSEAATAAADAKHQAAEEARASRAEARQRRRLGEPYTTADQLAQVDRLDGCAGTPDGDAVARLKETARLRPDVLAEPTIGALVEMADPAGGAPTAVRAAATGILAEAARSGRLSSERAVGLAVDALAVGPSPEAAELLACCTDRLEERHLSQAVVRSAIELAGRDRDPWGRVVARLGHGPVVSDPGPVLACVRVNHDLVVDAIAEMIERRVRRNSATDLVDARGAPLATVGVDEHKLDDRNCSVAAGAALVVARAEPTSRHRLINALGRSLDSPDWDRYDAPPSHVIAQVLGELLAYCPEEVVPEIHALARVLSVEGRQRLFRSVTHAATVTDEAASGRTTAVGLAIDRLGGDWGDEVAADAAVTLDDLARWHPDALVGRAAGLVGALMDAARAGDPPEAELNVIENPVIAHLQALGRRHARRATLHRLGMAVGRLVRAGATEAANAVLDLIEDADDGSDAALKVRAELTRLLGHIGEDPARTAAVLPLLYNGLLHADAGVRVAAVRSWERLARGPQSLPRTLVELLPALLSDPIVGVIAATLEVIPALELPDEAVLPVADRVVNLLLAVHKGSPDWAPDVIEPGVDALLFLSRQLDTPRAETAQAAALLVSEVLDTHDRRDVLRRAWMPRLTNSGIFAHRGLEVLASPDLVDFNGHDTTIQTALLGCPHGLGLQEMELFHLVGALHLPDSPWPALEMVELLQRAGRWVDASAFAHWVLSCIPNTPEHAARHRLAEAVAGLAASEEAVATRASNIPIPVHAQDDPPQLVAILRRAGAAADARRLLSGCLTPSGPVALEARAAQLVADADAMLGADDQTDAVATEQAWRLAAAGLRGIAALLRWDAEIQRGTADPERPHAAAVRVAEVALAAHPSSRNDVLLVPLLEALEALIAVNSPGQVGTLAGALATIPLPTRFVIAAKPVVMPWGQPQEQPPPPIAVAVFRLDGALVTNAHVVRPDERHDLTIEVRLTEWPDGADALDLSFLTVLGGHQVQLPRFSVPKPAPDSDGIYNISVDGRVSVAFSLPAGAAPESFPLAARFTGSGMDQIVRVAGHSELRLRPFDASTDGLTDRPQLDARLVEMFAYLHGMDLDHDDVQAFCRLFSAIARAATEIQFDDAYKHGARVSERSFHDDLHQRLRTDPTLEGRVQRGTPSAGGYLDVKHDHINAELKVVPDKTITVEESHRYLGQPADYACDLGAQLSILVILETTAKQAPPGVLENYIGWMQPQLHDLVDPRYPSLVGVIIINGNLPRPSVFSRRKIAGSRFPPLPPRAGSSMDSPPGDGPT